MSRTFQHSPPKLGYVGLKGAAFAPTGGGKTLSMIKLAEGMRMVSNKETFVIDTEISGDTGRAAFYKQHAKFQHVLLPPPHNPLSYVDAIEYCLSKGAGQIIVDSMSHEHEGVGGVLQMHDDVVAKRGENFNFIAWGPPKKERNVLLRTIQSCPAHLLLCFRAKERIKLPDKKAPNEEDRKVQQLGYMPIGAEEIFFEMLFSFLFPPGAEGKPQWDGLERGEKAMVKAPEFLRQMLHGHKGQITVDLGKQLAQWAHGQSTKQQPDRVVNLELIEAKFDAAESLPDLAKAWDTIDPDDRKDERVVAAKDKHKARLTPETPKQS